MNEQEAIEILKDGIENLDIPFLNPVYEVAIKALEKQIPKKVLETDDKDLSDIWYRCPVCKGDMTHIRGFYCPYCGQKLNWGEEEGGLNDI